MAALVLSAAGAAAGNTVFGPAGAIAGRLVGALAGNAIDRALFSSRREISQEGPRLADLEVMASTEGAPIPRVYGRARLSGQVIWATNLEEVVTTTSQATGGVGGKGMGGGSAVTTNTNTYSYFANLAVGLCEGPIGAVWRELRHRAQRQGVAADARVAQRLERRNRRGHCSRACGRSENPDCRYL